LSTTRRSLALVLSSLLLGLPGHAQTPRRTPPRPAARAATALARPTVPVKSPTIVSVRGAQRAAQLNKKVVVEGYFANDSVPMVVDDLARLSLNVVLPAEAYVPLGGKVPTTLRRGDRVKVSATLITGAQAGGALTNEVTALRIDDVTQVQVVATATLQPSRLKRLQVARLALSSKHAVLIAGGANPASNYLRYWTELSSAYGLLRARGYAAENITVVYADGVARDGTMPVSYSATKANIATVFNALATKVGASDTVYIMLDDHGGGFLNPSAGGYPVGSYGGALDSNGDELDAAISEAAVNLDLTGDGDRSDAANFDESLNLWNEKMYDDEFAAEVNKIKSYGTLIIQMEQCFSGGFVHDLLGPRRIVMSAAGADEFSWSTANGQFNEFTFWYLAALMGSKPDGTGAVNADGNADGKVSILEAYNFARTHDTRPEVPQFDDSGALPLRTGAVPAGDDGTLAAATFL
jgi:hypothetical protein